MKIIDQIRKLKLKNRDSFDNYYVSGDNLKVILKCLKKLYFSRFCKITVGLFHVS